LEEWEIRGEKRTDLLEMVLHGMDNERKQMKVLNIAALVMEQRLQSRVEINESLVSDYTEALQNGAEFPPVLVYFDGINHYLTDGYHRAHAYTRAGKVSIPCEVVNGTLRDAILCAVGVNDTHGLRRTNADKRKGVSILLEDFEWSLMSNSQIAKICGVSASFVANVKDSLGIEKSETVKYKTASGEIKEKKKASGRPAKPQEEEQPKQDFDPRDELIAHLTKENEIVQQRLAVAAMEGTEEEKSLAAKTIEELTEKIRILEIELVAVKNSRDRFQAENAQLKKQVAAQQKQLKKIEF